MWPTAECRAGQPRTELHAIGVTWLKTLGVGTNSTMGIRKFRNLSGYKDGEEYIAPVFTILTPLSPHSYPNFIFSPLQCSSKNNLSLYKTFCRSIFPPFPPRTQNYACALRHFSIAKHDFQQIRLTEAEVDAPISNYARNSLRCIYVWMLAVPTEVSVVLLCCDKWKENM